MIHNIAHRGASAYEPENTLPPSNEPFRWEPPSKLQELVKLGADGICTNTPDVLAAILKEQKGTL